MMSFFRRMINSKVGVIVSFVLIAIFALLFGMGDVLGLRHSGGATGDAAIKVGKFSVSTADVRERIEEDFGTYQQQSPQMTLAQFVTTGGMDATVDSIIDGLALEQFAAMQGMVVGDTYVQGILAASPAFQGADGKFSQRAFDDYLAQRHTSYARLKQQIVQSALARQLVIPTIGAQQVPGKVALPYASLLLEKREGQIALIPARAVPHGAAPTDAELAAFYQRHVAGYTVPERRAIRYAIVSPDSVKAQATPGDAEVAQTYQQQKAKYLPIEKRSFAQVVIADQAAANALAARVKGGASIEDAAKAAGLAAAAIKDVEQSAYAGQTSVAMANAAFTTPKGGVAGPIRTPLGYAVARVEAITRDPGKTLDQAKPEIVKALTKIKTADILRKIHDALDDAINGKASFGDLVTAQKLTPVTTPALIAAGTNPDDPAAKPDPKTAPIVTAAFAMDPADGPQLAPIGQDGTFAVVALDHVQPAAPRPLAQVRDAAIKDFTAERAETAARSYAGQVVAALDKGTPLAAALAATKLTLPPVQPISASRAQLAAAQGRAPPPLVMLFTMNERTARVIEAPDHAAYIIIFLDRIERGDAAGKPAVIAGIGSDLGKVVGREYVEQFQKAVRAVVGVSKNAAALAALKATLSGQGGSDQP